MNCQRQKRQRPGGNRGDYVKHLQAIYKPNSTASRLPADWRTRLERMDVGSYYARHVTKLGKPNATGWAQGVCPFHEDRNASLSAHVSGAGAWRCFAGCGGGDLIGFHIKRTGLPFADAVRDLLRGMP